MPEMFWSLKLGTMNVEFKNMAFVVTKHVHVHCQFEADPYKERRSNGSLKVVLQRSDKKGCPVDIRIKYITLYFLNMQFHHMWPVYKQELQEEMESKMTQLKKDQEFLKPMHAENKQVLCSLVNS